MKIVVKKEPLKFQKGGHEQFAPTDYKEAQKEWAFAQKRGENIRFHSRPTGSTAILSEDWPVDDPIHICKVSIATATKTGKRFIEVELMANIIMVPDTNCWFYIEIIYPWRIKTGRQDSDKILTDGDIYYICRRDLAKSPFVLNEYSKTKIEEAIGQYVSTI